MIKFDSKVRVSVTSACSPLSLHGGAADTFVEKGRAAQVSIILLVSMCVPEQVEHPGMRAEKLDPQANVLQALDPKTLAQTS